MKCFFIDAFLNSEAPQFLHDITNHCSFWIWPEIIPVIFDVVDARSHLVLVRGSYQECSLEKAVFKNFCNIHRKSPVSESFLIKLQTFRLIFLRPMFLIFKLLLSFVCFSFIWFASFLFRLKDSSPNFASYIKRS